MMKDTLISVIALGAIAALMVGIFTYEYQNVPEGDATKFVSETYVAGQMDLNYLPFNNGREMVSGTTVHEVTSAWFQASVSETVPLGTRLSYTFVTEGNQASGSFALGDKVELFGFDPTDFSLVVIIPGTHGGLEGPIVLNFEQLVPTQAQT